MTAVAPMSIGSVLESPSGAPHADGAGELTWEDAPRSPAGAAGWGLGASTAGAVVSTINSGSLASFDGAQTWQPVDAGIDEGDIVFDPTDPDRAFYGGFGGLARSTDAGATWELVLDTDRVRQLAVSQTGTIVASSQDEDFNTEILLSEDAGETWQTLDWPLDTPLIYGIAFGSTDDDIVVATISETTVTHDGGDTWTVQDNGGGDVISEPDGTLWRSSFSDLVRSTDDGDTWESTALGGANEMAPRPGGGIYAATGDGVQFTTDGGDTWTNMGAGEVSWAATGLVADPADPDAVLMSDESIGVTWVGPDGSGGYTFEGRTTGFPEVELSAVAAGPDADVHLAGGPLGLYASWDDGQTWTHTGGGIGFPSMSTVAAGPGGETLYAGGQNFIFQAYITVSHDGGDSWQVSLPEPNDGHTREIAVDPDDPDRAWAAIWTELAEDRVWQTTDGGQTWEPILTILGPEELQGVSYDADTDTLYAATSLGVHVREPTTGLWTRASAAAPPGATDIEAANGHVYAPGSVTSLWHGTSQAPLLTPWADTETEIEELGLDPATGEDLLALGSDGTMFRCQPDGTAPLGACSQTAGPDASVRELFVDADGTAWAATVDDGLQIAQLG